MKMRRFSVACGLAALSAVLVAACGSSPSSTTTSASQSATAGGTGASNVPAPPTTPPSGIGVSVSLRAAPAKGETVACALPSCTSFTPGFEAATKALGWNLKVITYQSGNPAPAVDQAVSEGANYIAMAGEPPALFRQALATANAKHIPLISANDTTPPAPSTGLMTQFGDQSMFGNEAVQLGEWIIANSGMKAHAVYVTIQDYPILQAGWTDLQSTFASYCPKTCSVAQLPITVNELASGAVPGKLVSYLQTHPDVNYIDFSFADPLVGVIPALKAAGMASHVKITGQALGAAPNVVAGLKDGSISAWVAQPNIYQAWLMVDAMARLSEVMPLTQERQAAEEPTWVVDTPSGVDNLNDSAGWNGPSGFETDFLKLWKVGS